MKSCLPVLALLLAAAGPLAAQQVYTWTDANGVKHFSDAPPPPNTKEAKKVIVRGGITSTEPDVPVKTEEEEAKEGPKMAAAAGYTAEDIKRNCETSQRNLEILQRSKPTAEAEVEVQVDYQEQVGKAQQQIALFCG
ncbi:MAG: DUF4124 domain-containing protein [Xanthomonadales bacterium]|nr:DUF4124 domain-containing protein [Xanthomonadales bacterium]